MKGTVELSNISIQLTGQKFLVQNFSHQFSVGEITLLQGVSGVGKTTLGKFIANIPIPQTHISGTKIYHDIDPIDIRYVPQHPSQYFIGNESIKRQISLISPKQTDKISELLSGMKLNLDQHVLQSKPDELSSGMRSRLMLAMTLSLSPKYVVVDEPLATVDGLTAIDILHVIKQLHIYSGCGLLLISHEWPKHSPMEPHHIIQMAKETT